MFSFSIVKPSFSFTNVKTITIRAVMLKPLQSGRYLPCVSRSYRPFWAALPDSIGVFFCFCFFVFRFCFCCFFFFYTCNFMLTTPTKVKKKVPAICAVNNSGLL